MNFREISMQSVIEKIRTHKKSLLFLVIPSVGTILVLILRLGTNHELNISHTCFDSNFRPAAQEFASNDAFVQLEPITADNIANITQEKKHLKDFRELIAEITFSPFEVTMPRVGHTALLRSTESHETIAKFSLSERESISSIEFNPSRTCVAFGSSLNKVKLFNTITGQEQESIQTGNWVLTIAFSPDGKMLAYGTAGDNDSIGDVTIGIWDLELNKKLHILKGHAWSIRSLVFSSDGKILASGGNDGAIRLWDTQTGQEIKILETYTETIMNLAFNHEGDLLAIATINTVGLWNLETDALIPLPVHTDKIEDIFFGPEDSFIAVIGANSDQIWIIE